MPRLKHLVILFEADCTARTNASTENRAILATLPTMTDQPTSDAKPQERILLVDDDAEIRSLLTMYLTDNCYIVRAVASAQDMRRLLERETFSLMILDVMLPDGDGISLCAQLRADKFFLPILMLTARGQEIDRILGIEVGADDYLAKPFSPRELLARLRALSRRKAYTLVPGAPVAKPIVVVADWEFDAQARTLTKGESTYALTTGEFALLNALVTHSPRPLSRERLVELSRTRDGEVNESFRSVDVQMARLRKIVEPDSRTPRYLQTVWGFGYVFVPSGKKATT
jgi:two-component system, OmpR family, phosphate regulon response regulator OmpR